MQRVIVTVKHQCEAQVRDLEVPAEVEAEHLSKMIAQALRWDSDQAGEPIEYEIMAEPPGRTLLPHETLADAGVWDGAWLVFQRPGSSPPPPPPPPVRPPPIGGKGPLEGWRPLGIDLPCETGPEPKQEEAPAEETGFVWKQLD